MALKIWEMMSNQPPDELQSLTGKCNIVFLKGEKFPLAFIFMMYVCMYVSIKTYLFSACIFFLASPVLSFLDFLYVCLFFVIVNRATLYTFVFPTK